jgi:hypothetical protein
MTTTIGNVIFVFVIFCLAVLFFAALAGFIFVQIKARPIWRLLSLTIVLMGSCWFCSFWTRQTLDEQYSDIYVRGSGEFMQSLDVLNLEGRTNDIHQSCQNFQVYFTLSTDKQDVSNFDQFVADTDKLTSKWTNSLPDPH